MVFSFRETVVAWINDTLIADLFIAPASNEIDRDVLLCSAGGLAIISRSHPAVETMDTFREIDLPMGEETEPFGRRCSRKSAATFPICSWQHARRSCVGFQTEACVVISESFARRHHLRNGESIDLTTPEGPHVSRSPGFFMITRAIRESFT